LRYSQVSNQAARERYTDDALAIGTCGIRIARGSVSATPDVLCIQ
jgi:hypothetical protein